MSTPQVIFPNGIKETIWGNGVGWGHSESLFSRT